MKEIQQLTVNAIRVLSAEAIDKANSGHPGLPLGCATIGYTLFADNLRHNPKDPAFFNRDRFVLSAGHGSMLLYSLLHLFGYGLTMEDIKTSASSVPVRPVIPSTAIPRGWRLPRAPWDRALPTPWVLRRRKPCLRRALTRTTAK